MQHRQVVPRRLLVARRHTAVVLDPTEEALHLVPILVELRVVLARLLAILPARDHRAGSQCLDLRHEPVRVVPLIREHGMDRFLVLHRQPDGVKQGLRLRDVVALAPGQRQHERIAERITDHVDLRREPAPAASERFAFSDLLRF